MMGKIARYVKNEEAGERNQQAGARLPALRPPAHWPGNFGNTAGEVPMGLFGGQAIGRSYFGGRDRVYVKDRRLVGGRS